MKKLLTGYLKAIAATTAQGDAREESYYDSLKGLFSDFPLEKGRKTLVTVLPKQTEAGNPDFRVWDGDHFIVGYLEAKAPGTNLDQAETSEQLTRYLNTFPNLILTDFYEFRLYRDGQLIDKVSIGRHFTARHLKTTPPLENAALMSELLEKFFAFKLPESFTAEKLAVELAKRTRFLRDQVVVEELRDQRPGAGNLSGFYTAFKKYLIAGLTPEQFADLYSQTITYGLFAARTRAKGEFNRKLAFDYIPPTIGILRDMFRFISFEELSPQMEVIVDDIAAVLNAAQINSILDQYYQEGKGDDPIIHFYETFLNAYDPETRERRGVYYTPEPVVTYIVRSVHELLKTKFGLRDGLADPAVTVLDPAAGTLTFPAEAIKLAVGEYVGKYGEGGKKGFIRDQILKNYYAFELMMAPYAIGHMKISLLLDSLGYTLQADDRFQLYLTNTLEMEEIDQIGIPGLHSLSEESHLAGKVKKEEPILVIMGNPPYSVSSENKNEWTEKLLKEDIDGCQTYYKVDDQTLGERNPKMLQDDYVKFLRFSQWKIGKAGFGIVGMITNHSYLDGPTFRGMRQSLLKTFDEIYILDLHGNSLKQETAPDGSRDENVFDIRVGVAIAFFVKYKRKSLRPGSVFHNDLYGKRQNKYDYLKTNDVKRTEWSEIQPTSKFYVYIPRDKSQEEIYKKFISVTDLFKVYGTGIKTHRDEFVYDFNENDLRRRIHQFRDLSISDEIIRQTYGLNNTRDWKLTENRKGLSTVLDWQEYFYPCLYRPFDVRSLYFHPNVVELPRQDIMKHMIRGNLGLITSRQMAKPETEPVFITNTIIDTHAITSSVSASYLFPLYLFPDYGENGLFGNLDIEKEVNFYGGFLDKLQEYYLEKPLPEEVLYYIYGVMFSTYYQNLYVDFLKYDFPKIPFSADYELFYRIGLLGKRLIDLHLLIGPELAQPTVKFQGQGENTLIDRRKYDPATGRVSINTDYYFEGVAPEVWVYQIGGYQVLDKYLKDRKGRKMDDPRHVIHIATALEKTIAIQAEIDALYPEVEKDLIEF